MDLILFYNDWFVCLALISIKGKGWGSLYSLVRGEILRPIEDKQKRKQSPNPSPSIKSESVGSEDDQIPS